MSPTRSSAKAPPCAAGPVEATGSAADFLPSRKTLPALRRAVQGCRGCTLYACATQAVFGEGPRKAAVMFVGEQPGDQEDRAGHPFVGPSGRLLDVAIAESDIARDDVYVTNAVKHFKWEPTPRAERRRIHKTPTRGEVTACKPWLDAEIALVQPRLIIALGATAAKALLGPAFRVSTARGKLQTLESGPMVVATVHPSAVLRAPPEERAKAERAFIRDVTTALRRIPT